MINDSHIINGSQMNKSNRFNIEEEQELNDNFNNFSDSKKESNINSTQKKNKNKTDSTYKKNNKFSDSKKDSNNNSTSNNKKNINSSDNKANNKLSSQKKKDKSSKKNTDQNLKLTEEDNQKEKRNKDKNEYNCYVPNKNEMNIDAPNIPPHYINFYDIDYNTRQNLIGKKKYLHFVEKDILSENSCYKNILSCPHVNLNHCCNCCKVGNDDKYIRTISTNGFLGER